MGFLDKKKNEEWIDGTPESFKIWFWIRLAVCLFLMYTGGELIYHYVEGEIGWGAIAGAAVFFIFGIVFLILDISRYVKLRRAVKQRDEAESSEDAGRTAGASSLGDGPSLSSPLAGGTLGSPERTEHDNNLSDVRSETSIRKFATYVVDDNIDEEDEADDEV